jgi:hypothetical protein
MEPETKPFWQSKTLWVNVIAGVATVAGVFKLDLGLTPEVQAELATGILAVVNIVLRFTTKTAVGK